MRRCGASLRIGTPMLDPVGASMGQADHDASAEAAQPFTEPVVDSGATVDAVVGVT